MRSGNLRLKNLRERLRSSLWFVPALASVLAFLAAHALVAVDRRLLRARRAWYLFAGEAESGVDLLSTIASSMITFTGLVFSITILVLQLASGQFSPRVLRTFMRDRNTQLAMGTFVGTFVFAMVVLPEVRSGEPQFVPALSLFVAFVLVLASVGMFIHYIDHMANSVRAITIIKRVSRDTRCAIVRMYPEELLETAHESVTVPSEPPSAVIVHEGDGGVLTAVDEDALASLTRSADVVLGLVPMLGDFVPRGSPLFCVWGGEPVDSEKAAGAVIIAEERTVHQDPAFGFRQLVDIAERALSPSVNDPSTAVQVLDEIHDLLRLMARRCFPSPLRVDPQGRLRLILPRPDWDAYVHLGLDEIRQYSGHSIQVARRLRALCEDCIAVCPPARRHALQQQLEALDAATHREFPDRTDREIARKPSIQGRGE